MKAQELVNLMPSDDEIKEMFTTPHYSQDIGHYKRVRFDRIQGAKVMRDKIIKVIQAAITVDA